jgi:hypothetical protein
LSNGQATQQKVQFARVDRISLGSFVVESPRVMVAPSQIEGDDWGHDLNIGYGFMRHYVVTFDYPGRKIMVKKGALAASDTSTTLAYGTDDPLPTVPLTIAGRETRVHLDTGSGHGLMLPTRFLEELPLASKPEPGGTARVHNGEAPITKARVDGPITLGPYALELPDVSFVDLKALFGPPRGNVGYQVLRDFVVTLDSRNRLVRLVR